MAEFGDRELDVMGVLWDAGSATVAEVRSRLPADLAYTTVLTILRNLESKGFVRHEGEGKAHRYFPLIAQKAAGTSAVARLVDKLFGGDPAMLVSHLVSDHPLSREELKRLHDKLRTRMAEEDKS
jgi:predicted transcriptional regulator